MLEMNITITAAGLEAAINNLATAIGGNAAANKAETTAMTTDQTTPTAPSIPVVPTMPAPPAVQPSVPVNPTPIPTSAPQYTFDMISTAGSALIDAGKIDQLVMLLGKFGVQSLTDLNPESYGAVANELRALGAKI
nr:MAG TPA: Protein of unknown function (DUF1018) [Caudoviricetes sp.]